MRTTGCKAAARRIVESPDKREPRVVEDPWFVAALDVAVKKKCTSLMPVATGDDQTAVERVNVRCCNRQRERGHDRAADQQIKGLVGQLGGETWTVPSWPRR